MRLAIRKSQRDQIELLNKLKARMIRRIFLQGIAANGQAIGTYSTKPMLVGSTSFTNLKGRVKSSNGVSKIFATKQARAKQKWVTTKSKQRLVQLEGGYQEFRKLVGRGRNGSKVNLDLTGALRESIVIGSSKGALVIGIKDAKNARKKQYLHMKYGTVFAASKQERIWFENQMEKAIQKNFEIALQNAA